jgi:hypothetical protein
MRRMTLLLLLTLTACQTETSKQPMASGVVCVNGAQYEVLEYGKFMVVKDNKHIPC